MTATDHQTGQVKSEKVTEGAQVAITGRVGDYLNHQCQVWHNCLTCLHDQV